MAERLAKHPVTGHPTKPAPKHSKAAGKSKAKVPAAKAKPKEAPVVLCQELVPDATGKYPPGRCSLGAHCKNEDFELRPHYKCKVCRLQLHNFALGCGAQYNEDGGVVCPEGFGCDLGRKGVAKASESEETDGSEGDAPIITKVKHPNPAPPRRPNLDSDDSDDSDSESELKHLHKKRPPETPMLQPCNDGEFPPLDYDSEDDSVQKALAKAKSAKKASSARKKSPNPSPYNEASTAETETPDKDKENKPHSFHRLFFDDEGKIIGYDGEIWKKIKADTLRAVASQCAGCGTRGWSKAACIDKINSEFDLWVGRGRPEPGHAVRNDGKQTTVPDRATANCKMRLFNVVFSDDHVDDLQELLSNPDSRGPADNGTASYQYWFWGPVRDSYIDSIEEYGQNKFATNPYFKDRPALNLGHYGQHSWKKLREMWKAMSSDYDEILKKYTASGEHCNDFFQFTKGNLVMYYFYLCLQEKPNILGVVQVNLLAQEGRDENQTASSASGKKRKKEAAFTDILKELADRDSDQAELAELAKARKETLALELNKYVLAQKMHQMEEERREEEKRSRMFAELDHIDQGLERLYVLMDKNPPEDRLARYKRQEERYLNRQAVLHDILFPKEQSDNEE
jgi:hypothetical protein